MRIEGIPNLPGPFGELLRTNPQAATLAVRKVLSEKKLSAFVRLMWKDVEPARDFVTGFHIDAICEHLEAVSNGEITRLLINVPPGSAKSLLCNVFWPAWEWLRAPSMRFVCFSYSQQLTVRDNIRFRQIIMGPLYRALWGDRFGPSEDMFSTVKVANNKTGWKLATSVSGLGTGERGDRLVMDDPNNVKEAESKAVRDSTNQWFQEVIPTRLNDPESSAIVIIQQRTHEEDVSGMAIARDLGYEHLCIPMRYDSARRCETSIGWEDPRSEDGELMWPARFPEHVTAALERELGSYAASGQLQQAPTPRGGGIIKSAHWQVYPESYEEEFDANGKPIRPLEYPPMEYVLASLDSAYTEKEENDYSALTVWGMWRKDGTPKVMLMAAWKERLAIHGTMPAMLPEEDELDYRIRCKKAWGLVEKVADTCKKCKVDRLLIENKASGISVAQELARLFSDFGFGVELVNPKGDKVARAYSVQHVFENGVIYAPNRAWAQMVIDEVSAFPKSAHDDLCFAAGTKIATRRGGVKIEDVVVGDQVLTPDGWRKVIASGQTGISVVIERFGLIATANHPIYHLAKSYQPLHSICSDNEIVRLTICGLLQTALLKSLNSMELSSGEWEASVDIICRNPKLMRDGSILRGFMWQFGNFMHSGRYREATKLITRMLTYSISSLITLNAFYKASIVACLKRILTARRMPGTWKVSGLNPLNGTSQMREGSGIESILRHRCFHLSKIESLFASFAAKILLQDTRREQDIALALAGRGWIGDENINVSARVRQNVRNAAPNSLQKTEQELSFVAQTVTPDQVAEAVVPVYNLTVESPSCFFANGILVHNCDSTFQAIKYLRDLDFALLSSEYGSILDDIRTPKRSPTPLYDV